MKFEKLSATAELVSSIAIVVTLIYLAIQSHQTNTMLLGNSRQAMLEADLTYLTLATNYPEAIANIYPLNSTMRREMSMISIMMRTREFAWFQFQNGIMDETTFEAYISNLSLVLAGEVGQEWWDTFSGVLDPKFLAYVSRRLENERLIPDAD